MRKFFVISLIFLLVLFTAIIKNSTKKIDEDIFVLEENIRGLKNEFENIKLEFEFLSSSERLLDFQKTYFEDNLIQKDIKEIEIIRKGFDHLKLKKLKVNNEK